MHNVRMIEILEDIDLKFQSLLFQFVEQLFFNDLDCTFLLSYPVNTLINPSKGTISNYLVQFICFREGFDVLILLDKGSCSSDYPFFIINSPSVKHRHEFLYRNQNKQFFRCNLPPELQSLQS